MFTLTNLNLLSLFIVISSRAGVSFLHGPHQLKDEGKIIYKRLTLRSNRV
jgi:hypothetical protein